MDDGIRRGGLIIKLDRCTPIHFDRKFLGYMADIQMGCLIMVLIMREEAFGFMDLNLTFTEIIL